MQRGEDLYEERDEIFPKNEENPEEEEEYRSFGENQDEGCYLSMYQDVDLPELTDNEYEAISSIKKNKPHLAIRDIRKQITAMIPRLEIHSNKMISLMFYRKRGIFWSTPPDLFEFFKTKQCQEALLQLAIRPAKYLMNSCLPFYHSRKGVHWTFEEENLLIMIMKKADSSIIFSFLGLCFPGRTGKQVHAHFLEMLHAGRIYDPRIVKSKQKYVFDPMIKRYFLTNAEKDLAQSLVDLTAKGIHVTEAMVKEKAMVHYKNSWILAERAAYQYFTLNGLEIRDEDSNIYCENFKKMMKEIQGNFEITDELLIDEDEQEELHDKTVMSIIKQYNLPKPKFTHKWFRKFLKRNRLSLRNAHYMRRGAIDMKYVRIFIKKLARYIVENGWNKVYNMDETSVRINNGSRRAVAPIGLESIEIDAKRNEKECFTAIMTCTRSQKFPIIILKRGMSVNKKGKKKIVATIRHSYLRSGDKTEVWATLNKQGWMNESIMIRYLNHLHEKIAAHKPCALLLDCFPAHRTPNVKAIAKELGITLIYVPANGTGLYQPLDRRLFGIVKAKLRSLAKSKIFNGKDRYNIIYQHLMKSWSEISEKALNAAWSIPELVEKINDLSYKPPEEEEEEEEFEEEEEEIDDLDQDFF